MIIPLLLLAVEILELAGEEDEEECLLALYSPAKSKKITMIKLKYVILYVSAVQLWSGI